MIDPEIPSVSWVRALINDLKNQIENIILNNGVTSVSGNIVDNTDPANPVVTQVQSDWNAVSGLAVVLNKPVIPTGDATPITYANLLLGIANQTLDDGKYILTTGDNIGEVVYVVNGQLSPKGNMNVDTNSQASIIVGDNAGKTGTFNVKKDATQLNLLTIQFFGWARLICSTNFSAPLVGHHLTTDTGATAIIQALRLPLTQRNFFLNTVVGDWDNATTVTDVELGETKNLQSYTAAETPAEIAFDIASRISGLGAFAVGDTVYINNNSSANGAVLTTPVVSGDGLIATLNNFAGGGTASLETTYDYLNDFINGYYDSANNAVNEAVTAFPFNNASSNNFLQDGGSDFTLSKPSMMVENNHFGGSFVIPTGYGGQYQNNNLYNHTILDLSLNAGNFIGNQININGGTFTPNKACTGLNVNTLTSDYANQITLDSNIIDFSALPEYAWTGEVDVNDTGNNLTTVNGLSVAPTYFKLFNFEADWTTMGTNIIPTAEVKKIWQLVNIASTNIVCTGTQWADCYHDNTNVYIIRTNT